MQYSSLKNKLPYNIGREKRPSEHNKPKNIFFSSKKGLREGLKKTVLPYFIRCCTFLRKNCIFPKQVLLPNDLLQLQTVHYGWYLQNSFRCELHTVSTTWLWLWFMKSDHHQKHPSSTATPHISTVHYGLQKNVG